MRIHRVRVQNFRCLDDVEVGFDEITTFIGPNGVGKSSILRALDWFFNGGSLDEEDVTSGATESFISVEVEFGELGRSDREQLGKYAAGGRETVTVWRRWEHGQDKMYGMGRAYRPFQTIRSKASASERLSEYRTFRDAHQDSGLPAARSDAAAKEAMDEWETAHPDLLEELTIDEPSHLFGFYGQAKMSGLFDYVLVTADLRANEQTQDSKSAILGRILERTVDRSGADEDLAALAQDMQVRQADVHRRHFDQQLADLSTAMTSAVSELSSGRQVLVSTLDVQIQPQKAQFAVRVLDDDIETRVDRQGHGFQRALLITALRLLAERGMAEDEQGEICLAIEEPELFQHPLQAVNFARVLRALAGDAGQRLQVAYATHSPYFLEPKSFHQVRRVSRTGVGSSAMVAVASSTLSSVVSSLNGFVTEDQVRKQLGNVCLGRLAEAFFAQGVLLVEGSTDAGVFGTSAERSRSLLLDGVWIVECGGKQSVLLPFAILRELGIPACLVVDNDRHLEIQLAAAAGDRDRERKLATNVADAKKLNRSFLRFWGLPEEDWPSGRLSDDLFFADGNLEMVLETTWPEWAETRDQLACAGATAEKNASLYCDACRNAPSEGSCEFVEDVLSAVRAR